MKAEVFGYKCRFYYNKSKSLVKHAQGKTLANGPEMEGRITKQSSEMQRQAKTKLCNVSSIRPCIYNLSNESHE